jgi:hypothetical protein
MPRLRLRFAPFSLVLALLGVAFVGVAYAEATVQVEVRPSVDGTVTITPNTPPARSFTCHTRGGTCTIAGVPGGLATVRFAPDGGGPAPAPHTVMIAPTGNVRLTVPSGR